MRNDDSRDYDEHTQQVCPAEGFLSQRQCRREGEDGYRVVEDAGLGGSEVAHRVVVARVCQGGTEDAEGGKEHEHFGAPGEQWQPAAVEDEHEGQEVEQPYDVLPCGDDQRVVLVDYLHEQQGVDHGYHYRAGDEFESNTSVEKSFVILAQSKKVTAKSKGNKTMTKATIGKNVTTIAKNTFKGDSKLKTVKLEGAKIKSVGDGAFSGIAKKATITISGTAKQVKKVTNLIKKSGVAKTVTIKRTK